jgi:ABC-type transporter Mla subunit MlaD
LITQKITKLPVVAGRYDNDFIQTADKFLKQLPTFCDEVNTAIKQINDTENKLNNIKDETNSYKKETLNYKNTTYGYKLEAVNAANRAEAVVIPTEATYNKDEIDAQLSEITRVQVAQQIIISYLQN